MSINPPGSISVLDHGFVAPILQPDSDLKVVNAARVSFHKTSTWGSDHTIPGERVDLRLTDKDAGLIRYLATHKHWTPFAHTRWLCRATLSPENLQVLTDLGGFSFRWLREDWWLVSFSLAHMMHVPYFDEAAKFSCPISLSAVQSVRTAFVPPLRESVEGLRFKDHWPEEIPATLHLKLPIFVDRQLVTHKVGFVRNEVSRRYLDGDDLPVEFHTPTIWRSRPPKNIKQGSGGPFDNLVTVQGQDDLPGAATARSFSRAGETYDGMCEAGVAPEQARIVLPLSTYTEHWTTASLRSWARLFRLRSDPHAQQEIREYAKAIDACLSIMHPDHWPRIRDTQ